MKQRKTTPLAFTMGAALISSLASNGASADFTTTAASNPFAMTELSSGYMLTAEAGAAAKSAEGKCGEGKCGDKKAKSAKGAESKSGKSPADDKNPQADQPAEPASAQ